MFFCVFFVFFFKQKTAYEMRISDWSSDVCSSDLARELVRFSAGITRNILYRNVAEPRRQDVGKHPGFVILHRVQGNGDSADAAVSLCRKFIRISGTINAARSEEHTSELQSLMRISYAVFCLKKKTQNTTNTNSITQQTKHQNT